MALIELETSDRDKLIDILMALDDWVSPGERSKLLKDVFHGWPARSKLLNKIRGGGYSRPATGDTVDKLADNYAGDGRVALGVLVERIAAHYADSEGAEFLEELQARYPGLSSEPSISAWRGDEDDKDKSTLERIIGENTLRDIWVLEALRDMARAVVRISGPSFGTGFMITPELLITNHHVIPTKERAARSAFQFNYELGRDNLVRKDIRTATACADEVFLTSKPAARNANPKELDYTIVKLNDVPPDIRPLPVADGEIAERERVAIIQHPGGHYKKFSMQNNFVEYCDEYIIQYRTSTEPGSSGAPALNDDLIVVALHHAGGRLTEPSSTKHVIRNEGIRMTAILDDLRANHPNVHEAILAAQPDRE